MNLFTRYLEYLKDNPEGYWFKRKGFGWGWTPARWQGWVVLAAFTATIGFVVATFATIPAPTSSEVVTLVLKVVVLVAVLIAICYAKGESPKWQWGFPDTGTKGSEINSEQ